MIKVNLQWNGNKFHPASHEDLELCRVYKSNQIVRANIKGHKRPRSVQQNKWLHGIFRVVAANTDNKKWNTDVKVKRQTKLAMKFYKDIFAVDETVWFEFRSFAFDEMEAPEADKVYSHARDVCADFLGVDADTLEKMAIQYYEDNRLTQHCGDLR